MWGPYWNHLLDGWSYRNNPNVHYMFYEDSKLDMKASLKSLAAFLEVPLRDEDLPQLMSHLDFETVKKNPSINWKFDPKLPAAYDHIRRGKIGGNPEMTDEYSAKIDAWMKENLKDSDLKFPC